MKYLSGVLTIVFFLLASNAMAQTPGYWEKTIVCTKCPSAIALDFDDSLDGAILLRSYRSGSSHNMTNVFATRDGGARWTLQQDRISNAGNDPGDEIVLRNGYLLINSVYGSTLRSTNFGDTIEVILKDRPSIELDFVTEDLSSLFIARSPLGSENILEVVVSRDSGRTYSLVSKLEMTTEDIFASVRFRDSNELWATIVHSPPSGIGRLRRLIYSTNQGVDWTEVYPIDTTGVDGSSTSFGQGAGLASESGIVPCVEPGSIYLVYNFYKSGTPDRRLMDLLYSTDYGKTWTGDSAHVINKKPFIDVAFIRNSGATQLWLVQSNKQTVAYSPDNAKTWVHDSVTFKGNPITQMLWKDSVTGYALTHSVDSTLTFWKYRHQPAAVEHFNQNHTQFFLLPSTVVSGDRLRLKALQALSGEFSAYDVMGRLVWTQGVRASKFERIELSIPSAPGVYFLTYSGDAYQKSVRYLQE